MFQSVIFGKPLLWSKNPSTALILSQYIHKVVQYHNSVPGIHDFILMFMMKISISPLVNWDAISRNSQTKSSDTSGTNNEIFSLSFTVFTITFWMKQYLKYFENCNFVSRKKTKLGHNFKSSNSSLGPIALKFYRSRFFIARGKYPPAPAPNLIRNLKSWC